MHVFPATLVVGLLAFSLSGCSSLPDREQVWSRSSEFFSQSAEVLKAQRKRLANFAGSLVTSKDDEARDEEVSALFAQPYIDPLTRYLEERSDDDRFAAQLARVAEERGRRCEEVADTYADRAATLDNLQRMRRGYLYSCPTEVQRFAARVDSGKNTDAKVSRPGSNEKTAQAAKREAQIKNPTTSPVSAASNDQPDTEMEDALSRRQHSDCYLLFTIRNNTQALEACEPLAAAGDAKAQHHMAQLALMGNDTAAAADWARQSAGQKYAPGQLTLGQILQNGQGVAKDPIRAHGLLKSAADQGLAEAAYYTGLSFQNGTGVSANAANAKTYLEQAASSGHIPAYFALAELHESSAPERARYWLDQAARNGSARAQYLLGESYAKGTHGEIDHEAAYVWYSLALLNGHDPAKAGIERQEQLLTSSQLANARSRVEDGINGRWD